MSIFWFVWSPVGPATSPGAGCSLYVFFCSWRKKGINFIWLPSHAFTSKTILISGLKIFPFQFAVGITWRNETLYSQKFSASPLQDFSIPSSVTALSAIVPRGQPLAPSARVVCGHCLLHQLSLFSWCQGTSWVLLLLQSPFCTWPEKPQWDGRSFTIIQFISPKKRDTTVEFC